MRHAPRLFAAILTALCFYCPQGALGQPAAPLDLNAIQDPDLQRELYQIAESSGWSSLISSGRLAVTLVVLSDSGPYRLAGINAHQMLYAASLPKIAILFAAMVAAQEGELEIGPALEQDLQDMIRVSCNACATRAMARVGRDKLLAILQRPQFGFYNEHLYGGLWVGKDYGARPAHHRDPLKGLSHGATTYQVARLYYRLFTGNLLHEAYTRKMLGYLARPGISHKFVEALEDEEEIKMWRKSGSWKTFHADSVLVKSADGNYILVGLVEAANGELILQKLARDVHDLIERL